MKDLIDQYSNGPQLLREAVRGMTADQLDARPIAGKWSTRQVVCHLADAELVYADRIKRVIVEDQPPLRAMNPDAFLAGLACDQRNVNDELELIDAVRRHVVGILRAVPEAAAERTGLHSEDGPITLRMLMERITRHIPHHIAAIEEKRRALGV